MATNNCNNLLITNINQSVKTTGMEISFIPTSSATSSYPFDVIIKNGLNNIIFNTITPIFYDSNTGTISIIIPANLVPNVSEVINIKIVVDANCGTNIDYIVQYYKPDAFIITTSTTTSNNIPKQIDKYIKIKPNINSGGFKVGKTYYYKCSSNTLNSDNCYKEFSENLDLSKILDNIPVDGTLIDCPPTLKWLLMDVFCVGNTGITTTISQTTKTPCNSGLKIGAVYYLSGSNYTINFTSTDVQSITWKLFNSNTIEIKNGNSGALTTSSFIANFGSLSNGDYKVKIFADNCSSSETDGTLQFNVSNATTNNTTSNTTNNTTSTTTSNTTSSTTSNTVNSVINFINYTKKSPIETVGGKYNPDSFPRIPNIVNSLDTVLQKTFPNWLVAWKVEGSNFSHSLVNNKTYHIGIPFMYDQKNIIYGGYGERCVDFVYEDYNPSSGIDNFCTGSQYNNNFNNQIDHNFSNFQSAIPFELRAGGGGSAGGDRNKEFLDNNTLYAYNEGATNGSLWFGKRDWYMGKSNVGLSDYDNEAIFDDDSKSLAILLGLSSKTLGYTFDQYANILGSGFIDPSKYPLVFNDSNSGYPPHFQLLNGNDGRPNSGEIGYCGTQCDNIIPTRGLWNPTYKIEIASIFSGSKGIVDFPNILPCTEISCLSSATFYQGESYIYDTDTNSSRQVNKYTQNANTQHMIARVIFCGDTHKWYCVNRLNNRRMILQAKIVCDQQQNGILTDKNTFRDTYIINDSLKNKHFNRHHSFLIGGFVAMTGCEWNIWDRNNAGVNLDGYHGAFGVINLLNQKKNFGNGIAKSFVDLKPNANFLLWTSEISYDNGGTWLQEKAQHYVLDYNSIQQRQFTHPDGYWGGLLGRSEHNEKTQCKLRVTFNEKVYYHTVTADMWETTNPEYANTALSNIPTSNKDYHYFLFKLNGNGGEVS